LSLKREALKVLRKIPLPPSSESLVVSEKYRSIFIPVNCAQNPFPGSTPQTIRASQADPGYVPNSV
jgi:hypothetical protein